MWHGIDDDEDDRIAAAAVEARKRAEHSTKFNIRPTPRVKVPTPEQVREPLTDLSTITDEVMILSEPETIVEVRSELTIAESNVNRIPHDEDEGSEFRFYERIATFKADGASWPRLRHLTYWVAHNAIAHPLLGVLPGVATVQLHELTSAWLGHDPDVARRILHAELHVPEITKRAAWLLHNLVAHPLIAILPCRLTFALHDWSAHAMGVPGWI